MLPFTEKVYFNERNITMKKFLCLCISLIALITLTLSASVTAFAESDAEEFETPEAESNSIDNESSNPFSEIYGLVLKNSDKLFSLLAFLSSLLIVFAYKKGLIPIINTGLSAIKKSSDSFESKASESLVKTEESLKFLTDKFASCINSIEGISKYVDELSEKLELMEAENGDRETLTTVMLSQVDMLYEIFMNSALPQYSKDALGEKFAQMKKSITGGEKNG